MDGILVLLALVALAIPLLIIVLLIGQSNLRTRVNKLEASLSALVRAEMQVSEPSLMPDIAAGSAPAQVASPPIAPDQPLIADLLPKVVGPDLSDSEPSEPRSEDAAVLDVASDAQGPIVLRPDRLVALVGWLSKNWVYVISAISLALAGVFFVQYGMERGLLPPGLRVLAAIAFGLALIGAGEWMRRRDGDESDAASANLPSVFSGAGLVAIFAGIVAARQLYGLIGPELAFGGLLATALGAVVLGWLHGPLLAAIGLLGAAATPFLVAGGSGPGPWLYGYYALIATIGLAVDAMRRWAWISVLALALGFGGAALMYWGGAGLAGAVAVLIALPMLAIVLPLLRAAPDHAGPSLTQTLLHPKAAGWPIFPTRLALGATLVASFGLWTLEAGTSAEGMLVFAGIAFLAVLLTLWTERAEGLADLAILPALAFVLRIATEALRYSPLPREFSAQAVLLRAPETPAPMTVSLILGMAVALSAAFAWRAMRSRGVAGVQLGLAAVLTAPIAAAGLELFWHPSNVIGAYPWALQVIALAAVMVALALRFAKLDAPDLRRAAHATLSALSLIALALFLISSASPLTLALTVLVVVAAWLDRRFDLFEMSWFVQAGVAVLGYRLFADPGLDWAMDGSLGMVLVTYLGVILGLLGALILLRPRGRVVAVGVLESSAAGVSAVLVNILIARWMIVQGDNSPIPQHAYVTLSSLPWLVLMVMQIYRMGLGGPLRKLRGAIAVLAGLGAASGIATAVTLFNPLFSYWPDDASGLVHGPLILDSLLLAYLVPGLILIGSALRLSNMPKLLKMPFLAAGIGLAALYCVLEIRRFWHGDFLGGTTVVQGELYSYTLALMALGAALLYQAIARRSVLLRRAAMAVIAVVVAKVFLWDASGLTGLTRVISFLGLGLSLAGLAWLNRWAGQVSGDVPPADPKG